MYGATYQVTTQLTNHDATYASYVVLCGVEGQRRNFAKLRHRFWRDPGRRNKLHHLALLRAVAPYWRKLTP
eukprot:15191017-Alexandrium_andersonii.AAC.1